MRLIDAVRSTPAGGLCLVSAPAGYGRRTLLAQALGDTATVISLPPGKVDLATWRRLALEALHAAPGPVEDLSSALRGAPSPWLVVLDVDPSAHPAVVSELQVLSHDCPESQRIAVTTAGGLGAAFARVRMAGRLVELDAGDLSLTHEESAQLLASLAPELRPNTADEVALLCDGWTGALTAVARHHTSHPDGDTLGWLRSQGAELLMGPWLDDLADEVREMLLDTAILDQLEPGLVDAVTARSAGHHLPRLAAPGGPIRLAEHPRTEDGTWFDRHPLLTMTLRYTASGRADEQARHRRAADWCHLHADLGGELTHLMAAGDAQRATDRFHAHENELMASGLAHMALRWYKTLADDRQAAENLLREGWACALTGRMLDAAVALDRLRTVTGSGTATATSTHPRVEQLDAEADVLDAWLSEYAGDVVRMVTSASRARDRFGDAWSTNSQQLVGLLLARGTLLLGDPAGGQRMVASLRANPFATAAMGEGRRADTEAAAAWACGQVHEARAWAARHDRWLRSQDPSRLHVRFRVSVTGLLCLAEAGRAHVALESLESALRAATDGGVTDLVTTHLAVATVLAGQLRLGPALAHTAAARATVLERSPTGGLLPLVGQLEARLRLAAGDAVRAERTIRHLPRGVERQMLSARLALLRGMPGATALVREIEPVTARQEVEHAVLAAWAYAGSSRHRAEQHLLSAADTASRHGMTSILVDAPEPLLELARRTAVHHVHEPLAGAVRVAQHARAEARPPSSVTGAAAGSERATPNGVGGALTRGEIQLLAMLPTRAANGRIAAELGVSVNTVKTRLRRLYTKLGVHDRDEAVAAARHLGVIAGSDGRYSSTRIG